MNNNNNSVKFFAYLCAELNSQRPITESALIKNNGNKTNTRTKQTNIASV
jgi:hypothetical protein